MTDLAPYQLAESWGNKADDYESLFVPLSGPAANAALDALQLTRGERFLDVAAGTGAVTVAASRRGANVTAVDYAEGMLRLLNEKLRRMAISNVETRQMDGQALEFDDESFDAAGSGFGIVWFSDPAKGLREMARVLKPGGRVFVSTTGHAGSSELQTLIGRAIAAAGAGVQGPVPAALPGAETLAAMLESAGFRGVRVNTRNMPWPIPDARTFWEKWALESPPSAARWQGQPNSVKRADGAEFIRLVEETGLAEFPTEVLIGVGQK